MVPFLFILLLSKVPVLCAFEIAIYHILIAAMIINCLRNRDCLFLLTLYKVVLSGFFLPAWFISCFYPISRMLPLTILGLSVGFVSSCFSAVLFNLIVVSLLEESLLLLGLCVFFWTLQGMFLAIWVSDGYLNGS